MKLELNAVRNRRRHYHNQVLLGNMDHRFIKVGGRVKGRFASKYFPVAYKDDQAHSIGPVDGFPSVHALLTWAQNHNLPQPTLLTVPTKAAA